jgi:hypothetical protein
VDDHWDPYEGRRPLFRRPLVRGSVAVLAAGAFLLITLLSTCAPRRSVPRTTTTTTTGGVAAVEVLR